MHHACPVSFTLLQLETGSISRGNRCLQPVMGTAERLCESSMVPDLQGTTQVKKLPGSNNSHSSSMEGPTLVPCSAGNALLLPSTATPLTESITAGVRHETDGPTTSTGHMAYLQEKFECNNLSEPAKELLFLSWRSKTSQTYDSHFKKCLGWCTKHGFDLFSGPISEVANFLADLHSQGYQSSSP